jgi:two-component system phosphate regulon sensor histidine kinase PhoR
VRLGLFWKLFGLFSLTVIVAMAITDLVVRTAWERSFHQQLEATLLQKAKSLSESLPEITGCTSRPNMSDVIHRHATALEVRVTVIDACGNVLADSSAEPGQMENHAQRPEFRAALNGTPVGLDTRTSRTLAVPFLYLAIPSRGGDTHGAVRVSYPLTNIQRESARIRNQLLYSSLGGLLASLFLAAFAAAAISRRSRRVMSFAAQLAEGDFQARLHEGSSDEFAQVAKSLNATAERLEENFRQVQDAKQRLEVLMNSMQEPVLAVSPDRRVQWFNMQMQRLCAQQLRIGSQLVESVRDPELLRAVQLTIDHGEVNHARSEMISPGRVFRVTAAPIPAGGAVAVLTEITDIEKTEKVRRDFIANVSHELRTPLTSIQGFTETLLESEPPSEQRQFLDVIRKSAKRMARLTEDLLTLARVESGEDALHLRAVFPSVVLSDCAESMRDVVKLSGKTLEIENDSVRPVSCDLDKIHQVMTNLVENAAKYARRGARINIGATDSETGVRFYVNDDGPGIPSEHLSRLYERFYRVDASRSQESGGTGLGLAIVKHIVLKHGGSVHVTSEIGKGSMFSFVLPFADDAADHLFTND